MKKLALSQSQIQDIINMYNNGISCKDIISKHNISNTSLYRILKANGVTSNRNVYKLHYTNLYSNEYKNTFVETEYHPLSDDYKNIVRVYFNEEYFDNIDTPNKAYILGLLLADGNNYDNRILRLSLKESDKSILDRIVKELEYDGELRYIDYKSKNYNQSNQYLLTLCSKHLCRALCFYGVVPNKSLILQFPTNIRHDLYRHLIRGYIDGDGSISKNTKDCRVRFISTYDFCKIAKLLVENTLQINCSIKKCHGSNITHEFQVAGKRQVNIFLNWIYSDSDMYIERKHDIYVNNYINNSLAA